ncbi:DUF2809 domain-containing protein [Actinoplanes sp. NPDC051494]|uniref:DUF2809 domain-containing protein n=1 Tax=Actinoplanes sp. NPDC051494 TaxID=3363907 RepID=UPI0037A08C7B
MKSVHVRLAGVLAVGLILATALGIRLLAGDNGVLDSSGPLAQYSGTALYASMIYAGVYVLAPATRPWPAGAVAVVFCWAVECFQLTGLPARWSAHSALSRLALGVQFDAGDLAWYTVGVLPLVALHTLVRWRARTREPSS